MDITEEEYDDYLMDDCVFRLYGIRQGLVERFYNEYKKVE